MSKGKDFRPRKRGFDDDDGPSGYEPRNRVVRQPFGGGFDSPAGGMALLRRSVLKDWPPRYSDDTPSEGVAQAAVTESEENPAEPLPIRKTRVRSLLKPEGPRRRRPAASSAA